MDYKFISKSEDDTFRLAADIESEKFPNMVICLDGELGSGKTMFVKGFARALGIDDNITSPTFNIIKEYLNGEAPLYHMDVYRFDEVEENIGITDYFNKGGVTIIEWSELVSDKLPEERLDIKIRVKDENTRVFIFDPHGEEYVSILDTIL